MKYAIEILQSERERIVESLKNGNKEKLSALKELDKALDWLILLQENNVDKACRYDFDELPYIEGHGGFSSYRLMIDNESDQTEDWVEYRKTKDDVYRLLIGDFLLISK